jgi:hypothetical protein
MTHSPIPHVSMYSQKMFTLKKETQRTFQLCDFECKDRCVFSHVRVSCIYKRLAVRTDNTSSLPSSSQVPQPARYGKFFKRQSPMGASESWTTCACVLVCLCHRVAPTPTDFQLEPVVRSTVCNIYGHESSIQKVDNNRRERRCSSVTKLDHAFGSTDLPGYWAYKYTINVLFPTRWEVRNILPSIICSCVLFYRWQRTCPDSVRSGVLLWKQLKWCLSVWFSPKRLFSEPTTHSQKRLIQCIESKQTKNIIIIIIIIIKTQITKRN